MQGDAIEVGVSLGRRRRKPSGDQLMQFQADIIGRPVLRNTSSTDVSAVKRSISPAWRWASGLHWTTSCALPPKTRDRFEPQLTPSERAELIGGWQQAVARATLGC